MMIMMMMIIIIMIIIIIIVMILIILITKYRKFDLLFKFFFQKLLLTKTVTKM